VRGEKRGTRGEWGDEEGRILWCICEISGELGVARNETLLERKSGTSARGFGSNNWEMLSG
jgi:hypothetical protein